MPSGEWEMQPTSVCIRYVSVHVAFDPVIHIVDGFDAMACLEAQQRTQLTVLQQLNLRKSLRIDSIAAKPRIHFPRGGPTPCLPGMLEAMAGRLAAMASRRT